MSATIALPLLSAEEMPDGLWEALAASCRLLSSVQVPVCFTGPIWRAEGYYLAQVMVEGTGKLWSWKRGEPLFVREGGI
jgi:hypothetical protein